MRATKSDGWVVVVGNDLPHAWSKVSSTLLALRFFGIELSNAAGPRMAIGVLAPCWSPPRLRPPARLPTPGERGEERGDVESR